MAIEAELPLFSFCMSSGTIGGLVLVLEVEDFDIPYLNQGFA